MPDFPWEPFWTLLLLFSGSAYLFTLNRIVRGLVNLPLANAQRQAQEWQPKVSVIIPCRDEAEHIGLALDDLGKQDYPAELIQIIVVDDRSADGTGDEARSRKEKLSNLTVVTIEFCPENVSPKKHAILQGLAKADGEIIITTDGDCRFKQGWIKEMIACFAPDVGVVAGLTVFDRNIEEPHWQKIQQTDYLSHSFFAAGAIGSGMAFNCNGSNLALRRETFEESGGYDQFSQVVTGDDTLLIQRIKQNGKWRIHFCTYPETIVRSCPEETPAQVFNQRLRWGSGGLSYSPTALALGLTTFVFFLSLFLSPLFWLGGLVSANWMLFFVLKAAQEVRVMKRGWQIFGITENWQIFSILELLHIPATLIFAIGGHLWGFRWKGQKFNRTRKHINLSETITK